VERLRSVSGGWYVVEATSDGVWVAVRQGSKDGGIRERGTREGEKVRVESGE